LGERKRRCLNESRGRESGKRNRNKEGEVRFTRRGREKEEVMEKGFWEEVGKRALAKGPI